MITIPNGRHWQALYLAVLAFLIAAGSPGTVCGQEQSVNHREEMIRFVKEISRYGKNRHPGFSIVPQNGIQLMAINRDGYLRPNTDYLDSIDGIARESVFYGYNRDNHATPQRIRKQITRYLNMAQNNGKKVMVIDYCWSPEKVDNSYEISDSLGYVSFAADHRELDTIPPRPDDPYRENDREIQSLSEINNFLYLINTRNFDNKGSFIDRLAATNHDLVVVDHYFNGHDPLTPRDVSALKVKANGGKRLVLAYMSIGEAEDYRYYWKSAWEEDPPEWLLDENPKWPGNYLVRYWMSGWKRLVMGSPHSYLDKILDAGFDGVYLDLVDAYRRFESGGK